MSAIALHTEPNGNDAQSITRGAKREKGGESERVKETIIECWVRVCNKLMGDREIV